MTAYEISISRFVRRLPLDEKNIITLTRLVLKGEKFPRTQLSIALVGDKRMADFAQKYAHRRYRTDVFAFDLGREAAGRIGQIILNSQLAREQAQKLKTDPEAELGLYLIHGLLHLAGYDDYRKKDAQKMHDRSRKYLLQMGFKNLPPMPSP